MSHTISTATETLPAPALGSSATESLSNPKSRGVVFAWGIFSYFVGISGLMALILATLGLVPFLGGPISFESDAMRIGFNASLVALFGIQHVIMAREPFKRRFAAAVHPAAVRSTFVFLSGLIMGAMIWLWQPLEGTVWSIESTALRSILIGACALGWGYMLIASFAIDHFELFGLAQVWRNLRGASTPAPRFKTRWMYRFDRHPIMTGVLFGLWCTPDMTLDRLVLALAMTGYMAIGVTIEERDLVTRHGVNYVDYARRAGTIVPRLRRVVLR